MTGIPSDIAGAAAQAGFTAPEASRIRDADRAGQAHASARQAQAADHAVDSVETGDGETEVYTDAEGAGSQGRAFAENPPEEGEKSTENGGLSKDEDGQIHLDIQG